MRMAFGDSLAACLVIAKIQVSVGHVKCETIKSQSAFQGFHTEVNFSHHVVTKT